MSCDRCGRPGGKERDMLEANRELAPSQFASGKFCRDCWNIITDKAVGFMKEKIKSERWCDFCEKRPATQTLSISTSIDNGMEIHEIGEPADLCETCCGRIVGRFQSNWSHLWTTAREHRCCD